MNCGGPFYAIFSRGGGNCNVGRKAMFPAKLCRAHPHIFPKFLVEVIHVFIAYLFGNIVYFHSVLQKEFLRVVDALSIHVGIEAFTYFFVKILPR